MHVFCSQFSLFLLDRRIIFLLHVVLEFLLRIEGYLITRVSHDSLGHEGKIQELFLGRSCRQGRICWGGRYLSWHRNETLVHVPSVLLVRNRRLERRLDL